MNKKGYFLLVTLLFIQCETQSNFGPCVHEYREPVLIITSVLDTQTGTFIDSVHIRGIEIDDQPIDLFVLAAGETQNIVRTDTVLAGSPPCGFGTQNGNYEFIVSAPGYQDTVVTQYAEYAVNQGNCPSYSDEGTRITIQVQPE